MLGLLAGCSAPDREFDLVSFNSSIDQPLIAQYYHKEAFRLRQQAEELDARREVYERMFGPESDWVSGVSLLAQSYRLAADDQERLAREHLEAGRGVKSSASSRRPHASSERTP
jgi:hypothetical protein